MRRAVAIAAATALLALAPAVEAHVGSPDAVQDGQAGPYHLLVTIRPPEVIPGVAHGIAHGPARDQAKQRKGDGR